MLFILDDLRYAIRVLARQGGFSLAVILVLSLAIGANTAIFGIVNTVLLKPLPYRDAGGLFFAWSRNLQRDIPQANFSPPDYLDLSRRARGFSQFSAYRHHSATMVGHGQAQRVTCILATPNFFPMLGLQPATGRSFTEEESVYGKGRVVLLSANFWRSKFGGDPGIVGKTLNLDGESFEIVGIVPSIPGEMFTVDMYLPAAFSPPELEARNARYLSLMGRLAQGVTPQQAAAELTSLAEGIARDHPASEPGWSVYLTQAHEEFTQEARQPLVLLSAAVALVLLIACANLAGLLLVRASARRKEFAVRASLGAGTPRMFRQLVLESTLLSLAAGIVGAGLAWVVVRLISSAEVTTFPRLEAAAVDLLTLGFNFAAALAAGLLFGLAPALQVLRLNLADTLKDEGRGTSAGTGASAARKILVVSEVALSVILLTGAGLLLRTFQSIGRIDPGFHSEGVLTLRATLPEARYPTPESRAGYVERLQDRLRALPGATQTGITTALPLSQTNWRATFITTGESSGAGKPQMATYNAITPGYLDAVGARLLLGRDFSRTDTLQSPPVVLISEALRKAHFSGVDPVGRFLKLKVARYEYDAEIVGVVRDMAHLELDEGPRVAVYQPHAQLPWPFLSMALRTNGEPETLIPSVRKVFAELDSELAVDRITSLSALVDRSLSQRRLAMRLLSLFAAAAVLLAAIGLYGVLAAAVTQRVREFGVRIAMGATAWDLVTLVLRGGLGLSVAGLAAGLLAAPVGARLLTKMLYGVQPIDPLTYTGVGFVVLVVSLLACLIPAWRAGRTDPASALRAE